MQKQLQLKALKTQKAKTKMSVALGMNIAIFAMVLLASILMFGNIDAFEWQSQWHPGTIMTVWEKLKFFTVLSNLFMGAIAGVMIIMISLLKAKKIRKIHRSVYILDLISTLGVALTGLVTIFFLTPFGTMFGETFFTPKRLFTGANLFYHVIVPVFSTTTFVAFLNTQEIKLKEIFYVFIPVVAYFAFYLSMSLTHIDPETHLPMPGYDWYRMFQFGYPLAAAFGVIILGMTFLITWLLWLGNRKIQAKKIAFSYVLNILVLSLGVAQLVWMMTSGSPEWKMSQTKYFTNQSNWLMTLAAFVYLIFMILKDTKVLKRIPTGIQVFNLLTTVGVAITFLVVVGFMLPTCTVNPFKDNSGILDQWNMLYHVLTPCFAITTYLLVNHCPDMKFRYNWLSVILCGTYMLFYVISAFKHMNPETGYIPEPYDWYGIITAFGDYTILIFSLFILLNVGVSALLWFGNRNIHFGEPKAMPYKKLREQLWFIRRWY